MPKVLRLITRLNIGGPARQALLLTRALRSRFPTTLAAGESPMSEGVLEDPEVDIQRVSLVRPVRPIADVRALRDIRRLARSHHLVHTHMAKAGALGRLAASSLRPRPVTVHTFHGHVLDEYFSPPVQTMFVELERRLASVTNVLVAVSPEVRDSLLSKGIGEPDKFRVIPLGFELDRFTSLDGPTGRFRSTLGVAEEVPLIAIIGRLAPIKDHANLLQAMQQLSGVHVAVVGDGVLRESLEQRAAALGVGRRVHFTGWRLDIADVLADVDAVVLTSKNEGTPVSLIESLAAARPVVTTDVGGVRHVVKDGETGYICPAGDPQTFAAAVHRLLDEPEKAAAMGMKGRQDVRTRFGADRLVGDVATLYEELLA